jgi:hypothetical protein
MNFAGNSNISKDEMMKFMKSPMMKNMMGEDYSEDCEKLLEDPKMVA